MEEAKALSAETAECGQPLKRHKTRGGEKLPRRRRTKNESMRKMGLYIAMRCWGLPALAHYRENK